MAENTAQVFMLFGLGKLVTAKTKLLAWQAQAPTPCKQQVRRRVKTLGLNHFKLPGPSALRA